MLFQNLFGRNSENNKRKEQKSNAPQKRRLGFEPLESRELLSVAPVEPLQDFENPADVASPLPSAALLGR